MIPTEDTSDLDGRSDESSPPPFADRPRRYAEENGKVIRVDELCYRGSPAVEGGVAALVDRHDRASSLAPETTTPRAPPWPWWKRASLPEAERGGGRGERRLAASEDR